MLQITKRTKKWLPIVRAEIQRANYPFVPELILSLIQYESAGEAGAVNEKSGASGLIQVMPGTLKGYNQKHKNKISLETMRSMGTYPGKMQIRVGLWVLAKYWQSAYKWIRKQRETVPVSELARFGDAFYAAGPGRVKGMASELSRTWQQWTKKYPKSNITLHADRVWSTTESQSPTWNLKKIDEFLENDFVTTEYRDKLGFVVAIALLILAKYILFNGRKTNDGQTKTA